MWEVRSGLDMTFDINTIAMAFVEIALLYCGFRLFLSCSHIDSPCLRPEKNANIDSVKLRMSCDTEDNDMLMSRITIKARASSSVARD